MHLLRFSLRASAAAADDLQGISRWIHVDVIRALVHHTSAVVAAVVLFAIVGFIVQRLMHDGPIKHAVLWIDEFVLLCLFVYFAYELLTSL